MFNRLAIAVVALFLSSAASAETLTVIGYNVESDNDTQPSIVASDLKSLRVESIDIWGLSEVPPKEQARYLKATGSRNRYFVSRSGRQDRLMIAYNPRRVRLLETRELHFIRRDNTDGHRATLVGLFEVGGTDRFAFMVNHLARGDAGLRKRQAEKLREWARALEVPVVAVGDYNFDFDVPNGPGNDGFDEFMMSGVFEWIKPSNPMSTQCNPRYNSILDFVFVSGDAKQWSTQRSEILFPTATYCDAEADGGADHRPVIAKFSF